MKKFFLFLLALVALQLHAQDLEQYFRRLAERYRSADGTKE